MLLGLLLLGSVHPLQAQERDMVYPPELYAGENVVTIRIPGGIREIRAAHTPNISVEGAGVVSCNEEHQLYVTLHSASEQAALELTIVDCRNRRYVRTITQNTVWTVDQNRFNTVEVGKTVCRDFHIRSTGLERLYLDSITIADPRAKINVPGRLPARIDSPDLYTYNVCFRAESPGIYKFPVVTWMRRRYPSGGLTTYPVADTGYVRVIPKRVDSAVDEPPVTDPTTFRSVVVPNAIVPKRGTLYVGVYDLLGLTAGYSLDDHLMVIAGGALPTPDDWGGMRGEIFGAYSIGLKIGLPLGDQFNAAAGYQWGRSFYDKESEIAVDTVRSTINVHAPYLALSYGDDDSRLSATLAYAFKHHSKNNVEFNDNAALLAIGGDTRFARNWKVAGEIIMMQKLGIVPIIGTVRYFSDNYAFDLGVGYVGITTGDTKSPAIPLVPVVSGVFVF